MSGVSPVTTTVSATCATRSVDVEVRHARDVDDDVVPLDARESLQLDDDVVQPDRERGEAVEAFGVGDRFAHEAGVAVRGRHGRRRARRRPVRPRRGR